MIKRIILPVILSISVIMLSSCGGGGGGGGRSNSSQSGGYNQFAPSSVKLVGASTLGNDAIQVEWLPATDDKTIENKLKYQVHASISEDFTPTASSNKGEYTGKLFATVGGLQPDTEYFLTIVAIDEDGYESWSNRLTARTFKEKGALNENVTLHEQQKNTISHLTENTIEYQSTENNVPATGDFLVSGDEGYLRKVVSVEEVESGNVKVHTEPAAINEVFENFQLSSSFKLVDTQNTSNRSNKQFKTTLKSAGTEMEWGSGLLIRSSQSPKLTGYKSTGSMLKEKSTPDQVVEGELRTVTLPSYAVVAPGEPWRSPIKLEGDSSICVEHCGGGIIPLPTATYAPATVCSLRRKNFAHPDDEINQKIENGDLLVPVVDYSNGEYELAFLSSEEHLSDKAYDASFEMEIGTEEQCAKKKPEETIEFDMPFFVTKGDLDFVDQIERWQILDEENRKLAVNFDLGFEPDVTFDAYATTTGLQSAKASIKGEFSLDSLIELELSKYLDKKFTKLDIFSKEFQKVFYVGGAPVYLSGKLSFHGRVDVQTGVELDITQTFSNTHSLEVGLEYKNGAWSPISDYRNKFTHTIRSEVHGNLNVVVTLIPNLKIELYEALASEVLTDPSLYADVGVKAFANGIEDDDGPEVDYDYKFDQLDVGVIAGFYLYAGAGVFDKTLISYPDNIPYNNNFSLDEKLNNYKKFNLIEGVSADGLPIPKLKIAGLPKLLVEPDLNAKNYSDDSRAIKVEGGVENYPSPFYTRWKLGRESVFPFKTWIVPTPLVARLDPVTNTFINIQPTTDEAEIVTNSLAPESSYWFIPKQPGNYTVRLRGYSILGSWIRQNAEEPVMASDNDNDEMADYWENRWGVNDPQADPDNDCLTNLEEYRSGKFPDRKDNECEVTSLQAPVLNDLFTYSNALATITWSQVANAEQYVVYFSDKPSVSENQHIQKFVTTTREQNISVVLENKAYYAVVMAKRGS